jgi:2-furoyl-CoA dehydrogenase FAD binding subunit
VLIDVSRIAALDVIREVDGTIEIGAAVTQSKVLAWPHLPAKLPLLAAALPYVGHFQTRNKGTVCGSIAHADPSSELPLALAVGGGQVVLRSRRGERTLSPGEFPQDLLTTARLPDELITAVRYPVMTAGQGFGFREVARRHGDFAIIAVAAVADAKRSVRLGVGGIAGRPVVRGLAPGADVAEAVADWVDGLEGYEDLHASAGLRRDILRNLAPRVAAEAMACAA